MSEMRAGMNLVQSLRTLVAGSDRDIAEVAKVLVAEHMRERAKAFIATRHHNMGVEGCKALINSITAYEEHLVSEQLSGMSKPKAKAKVKAKAKSKGKTLVEVLADV